MSTRGWTSPTGCDHCRDLLRGERLSDVEAGWRDVAAKIEVSAQTYFDSLNQDQRNEWIHRLHHRTISDHSRISTLEMRVEILERRGVWRRLKAWWRRGC